MKTYEEMAQSALTRGKAIRKQRNRTKAIILGTVSALTACCIALVLILGIRGEKPNPKQPESPLNYGPINFLTIDAKTSSYVTNQPYRYIEGTSTSGGGGVSACIGPPEFSVHSVNLVAKAVEQYPGVYESLILYGGQYRLFRMEVIDPLQSGMEGTFYYILPNNMEGDLTQYDALLLAMSQYPKNTILRSGDQLTAFDYLFSSYYANPGMGDILPFTDGVFDESLWQGEGWDYVCRYYQHSKDEIDNGLLVYEGCTLEETLRLRQAKIAEQSKYFRIKEVWHHNFRTEGVQQIMDDVKPFENGVFATNGSARSFRIRRYINGCPTNESIYIHDEFGTIEYSEFRFEDEDFEKLVDIPAYIASLDLSRFTPQHTDIEGKTLIYNSAMGWYEKTENGVYSIVKVAWRYVDKSEQPQQYYPEYYDETFILLDETGDHIITAEDLIDLIGENDNISPEYYGKGIIIP